MARAEGQPFTQCETSSSALLAEKVPTIQQIRKLLFHSFKHSQGDANLQYNIFCYLRQFHPNWCIDESLSEAIVTASAQAILKHLPVVYPVGTSIPPQPLTHFPIL